MSQWRMGAWLASYAWGGAGGIGATPLPDQRHRRLANLYCPHCGGDLYLALGPCRAFEPCPLEHCKRLLLLPGYHERPAIARRVELLPNGLPAWPFDPCAGVS